MKDPDRRRGLNSKDSRDVVNCPEKLLAFLRDWRTVGLLVHLVDQNGGESGEEEEQRCAYPEHEPKPGNQARGKTEGECGEHAAEDAPAHKNDLALGRERLF